MTASAGRRETTPTTARLVEVSQRLLAEDTSLVASLQGVAAAGCSLIHGCTAASITIVQTGQPMSIAATDDVADALDRAQYEAGTGPCLAAAHEEQIVDVPRAAEEPRWPAFAQAARTTGVGSSLSVGLSLPGATTFGGLNCYATAADAFDEEDRRIVESFAAQASAVVSNAIAYWTAFDQAANLAKAMEHRAVIEQAKGILMATQHCSADEAFELLRRASQRENRKLRDIAADIVARTSNGGTA